MQFRRQGTTVFIKLELKKIHIFILQYSFIQLLLIYIFNFIRRDQNDSSKTIIRKKQHKSKLTVSHVYRYKDHNESYLLTKTWHNKYRWVNIIFLYKLEKFFLRIWLIILDAELPLGSSYPVQRLLSCLSASSPKRQQILFSVALYFCKNLAVLTSTW